MNKLTNIEPWPNRKLPQERFDEKVQLAMNQMLVMVNQFNGAITGRKYSLIKNSCLDIG